MTTTSAAAAGADFSSEREAREGLTILTMHGTVSTGFDARKLAGSVRTKKLVLFMRDVRRFASWGMSEWMEFLRLNAERDLYLIECSTYAVSQINLVTGLLGQAKLISFYASYRCGSCSEESSKLILIPKLGEEIRNLPDSTEECRTCGGRARLEEYPAAFFDTIANRGAFDIDDEVLAYLRKDLSYDLAADPSRFRAHRRVSGDFNYVRMSGALDRLPVDTVTAASAGKIVVLDLEGLIYQPGATLAWRDYMTSILPKVEQLQLERCPTGFLESAVTAADLHDRVKIRSFMLQYECLRCETQTSRLVDVAENLEQLVGGTAPTARCTTCDSLLVADLGPERVMQLRSLPARERNPNLDKFVAKAHSASLDDLENCLSPLASSSSKAKRSRTVAIGVAAGVLVAGAATLAIAPWKHAASGGTTGSGGAVGSQGVQTGGSNQQPQQPQFERPSWVMSDQPGSSYCQDMINRLMCVGVSSYQADRTAGAAEANDAALDELVVSLGLKISDPYFKSNVLAPYSEARTSALAALDAADIDRATEAAKTAQQKIADARKRLVDALRASAGPAVPSQRSDWYWEEYAAKGGGTEFLVFVRYDIAMDAQKLLVEQYSAQTKIKDGVVMSAFPALAWLSPTFSGGALVVKPAHAWSGIAAGDLVTSIGTQRVADAASLARGLGDAKEPVSLTVQTGSAAARTVSVKP